MGARACMTAVLMGLILATTSVEARAQCREIELDQESYMAVSGRVYVYTGDIQSLKSGSSYNPFQVHVLVGQYRAPFLLPQARLTEKDFTALFASRKDVQRVTLSVKVPSTKESVSVKDGTRSITLRVVRVLPSSKGTDRVVLEACSP